MTPRYRDDSPIGAAYIVRVYARLIFALLLAAIALPAPGAGACHATAPAAMERHDAHRMPHRDDHAAMTHMCAGCIPPVSVAPHTLDVPIAGSAPSHPRLATAFAPRSGTPPALPPPRRDA